MDTSRPSEEGDRHENLLALGACLGEHFAEQDDVVRAAMKLPEHCRAPTVAKRVQFLVHGIIQGNGQPVPASSSPLSPEQSRERAQRRTDQILGAIPDNVWNEAAARHGRTVEEERQHGRNKVLAGLATE